MKKELLNVERYTYNYKKKDYYIYLLPNSEYKEFTDFYIQDVERGKLNFEIGIKIDDLNCSIEKFIKKNIKDWTEDFKERIIDSSIL